MASLSHRMLSGGLFMIMIAGTPAKADARPITLAAQQVDGRAVLTVVGHSPVPVTVAYELAVVGSSRLQQKGRAALRPGEQVELVRLSIAPPDDWNATLTVSGDVDTYTVRLSDKATTP